MITHKSVRLREPGPLDACTPQILRCAQDDRAGFCHPELPFTSHKRGIDETWDPARGAGNSEFQTAAKDLRRACVQRTWLT